VCGWVCGGAHKAESNSSLPFFRAYLHQHLTSRQLWHGNLFDDGCISKTFSNFAAPHRPVRCRHSAKLRLQRAQMRLCENANTCVQFRGAAARRSSPSACRAPPEVRNSSRRILGRGDCAELVSFSHQIFNPRCICSPVFLSCLWEFGRHRCL